VRVVAFAAGLAVVFVAALGVGNAVGPVADDAVTHDEEHTATNADAHDGGHASAAGPAAEVPGGLMVSEAGYTLRLAEQEARPGRDVPLSFVIEGPDGEPVTDYEMEHEKELHLIAVRRDLTGFQHVHPERSTAGVWSTDLDLTPGAWRLFADFKAAGARALTLGTDLAVAGDFRPEPPVGEIRTALVDGYQVTLDGELDAGADAELTLSVSKDGRPVTDLEPYLGAFGHLVALREGDLAYLHVHPDGTPGDGSTAPGPEVVFYAEVPSDGRYRLYLDFQHDGIVRTAAFAVSTGEAAAHEGGGDHGH
jgi:hypothetical protein